MMTLIAVHGGWMTDDGNVWPTQAEAAEIEAADARGAADFALGVSMISNPYATDDLRVAWSEGWYRAQHSREVAS
jgi:hypothetical protein